MGKKFEICLQKFVVDFSGYKYSISFVGNPSEENILETLCELVKVYKNKLHIFCKEKDFLRSVEKIKKKNLLNEEDFEIFLKRKHELPVCEDEIAKIYNSSKINLNITSKENSPLKIKVFEILASGGFLISSETKNSEKYLKKSKHFETFTDKNDLIDKIDFYLTNLNIAQKIAQLGRFEIIKKHSISIVKSKSKRV